MFVSWVVFPLVMLVVCLGCGLAIERLSGMTLPGTLLPSVGLAAMIVVATLTTQHSSTAPTTTWVIVALALAGFITSWPRVLALRLEPWPLAVGLGVFVVCAAPVVLSGNPSFLGYFVDNDSAFHFALIDQLLSHGRNLTRLTNSAYLQAVREYLVTAYPTGADVALGSLRPLVGQDVAWIFQPYLAVILSLGSVAIYELLRSTVRSPALRATCAFIAAQPGLVYAFYLEDSIKELATTWIVTVAVALVFVTLRRLTLRGLLPLLLVTVAGLDVLELAVVPWLAVPLATFAVLAVWRSRRTLRSASRPRLAAAAAAVVAVGAVLAEPIISRASTFFSAATSILGQGAANVPAQLGNLADPLQHWQILGIWPAGDFRDPLTAHYRVGYVLIGIAIASAVFGTIWLVRRRALPALVLLAGGCLATIYLLGRSSPYAASKVMMIFSVPAVLAAMLGGAALVDIGRRLEGWILAAVIAAGVMWTNALAYSNASVAPRGRLGELAAIGARFNGIGPTLYNQSDEFSLYFLRNEAVVEPANGPVTPRAGLPPRTPGQFRLPWDPDDLDFNYLESFRLLVLGRSPRSSRPPANFALAYRGRYYDVWKRTATPSVLAHIPLGGGLYPDAVPSCRSVLATARRAERLRARLAYVPRGPVPTLVPTRTKYPPNWGVVDGDPYELNPRAQPGVITGTVRVTQPGTYQVWLESSLSQRFPVWVGGRYVGAVQYQLGPQGQFVPVGHVRLSAGNQSVRIVRPTVNVRPGQDSTGMYLGPLMLLGGAPSPAVVELDPSQAQSICGRSLDWLEIVR